MRFYIMITNEMAIMWKEVVYFKEVSQHSVGGRDENISQES
jgi:hypothetical protein